jgi:hypothetical protein
LRSRRETKTGAGERHRHRAPASLRAGLRGRSSRRRPRRLGPLDYAILALIVLGIAITIVMALLDPSG